MKSFLRLRSVRIASALAIASGLAGTVGLVASTTSATQAGADPASGVSLYTGVGADVTEDVFDAIAGVAPTPGSGATNIKYYAPLTSSVATGAKTIASYDASPEPGTTVTPGCITTRTGGPSFDRPNSTTAGITALLAAINGGNSWENSSGSCTNADVNVTGQISFARAARGPKTGGSTLTFIPYGRDALGFLYYDDGDGSLNSLTTAELQALYSSATGTTTIDGQTVYACLPISTSSPVTNIESALSLSSTQVEAAATAAGCNGIQQNSGDSFYAAAVALPPGTASHAVIPISSGSWIGQANGVGFDRSSVGRANGVDLASVDALGQPYTGTAPNEVPNTTYYQTTQYGYNVYTVVPTAKLTGFAPDTALENLFVGTGSQLCSATEQAIVNKFGFDSLTAAEGTCGSTTTTGDT
jgi:hypothetical protein